VVVVQCVSDPFYLGLFAHLAHSFRCRSDAKVELLVPQSFNVTIGTGLLALILRTFPINRLKINQWIRIWSVVSPDVGYRSTSLGYPLGDLVDAWRSWLIWRELKSADELCELVISGVPCGDLVIDSYLRFRPSPRVNLRDPFLMRVLWQAHRDVRRAQAYFRKKKPYLYITSYSTYVQHGIALRVALSEDVRVLSFGNFQDFGKLHQKDDFYHTRNCTNYLHEFRKIPNPEEIIEVARLQLEARLAGDIDSATAYMNASAYITKTDDVPDVHDKVIIFLHDFYDSPHVYADFVFPDFWEWVCFTINTLKVAGVSCLIKPHPNQIALSDAAIDELLSRFPEVQFISPHVTNRQLAQGGMACGVTAYGTVAHEMAYMGVPTIACASHPHITFEFCRTAKTRAEYADLLRDALAQPIDRTVLREQAIQFYIMHNLNYSIAHVQRRDALIRAWKICDDPHASAEAITDQFRIISEQSDFERLVSQALNT